MLDGLQQVDINIPRFKHAVKRTGLRAAIFRSLSGAKYLALERFTQPLFEFVGSYERKTLMSRKACGCRYFMFFR